MMRFADFVPFWVLFAAVAGSTYTPCDDCTDKANTGVLAAMEVRAYTSADEYTSASVSDTASLNDVINPSLSTIIYISGWTESPESTSVQTLLEAWFTLEEEYNILICDWNEIAAQEYNYCAESANGIGYTLATVLDNLVAAGLDETKIHVIGHSLGAQIAGYIGRYVNFTLSRITGLDPALPSFPESGDHLSSSDATYVVAIHTNPGFFGIDYSDASVDFWVNGISGVQPGCESDNLITTYSDSHARSWKYYAESILDKDAFIAVPCDSWSSFVDGTCSSSSDEEVVMGHATPTTASGDYYLQTNSESPFGKGTEGATYTA